MSAGLIAMEMTRGDGSMGTFLVVHGGLAMKSIFMLGSEEQKRKWLPPMARLKKIGAFALTEPDHGSDSVALETSARRDGDSYVINGAKKWIGNGTIADVVVVWARDVEDGQVKGFLVEKGTPGYNAKKIEHKVPLRAVWQAEIALDEMMVPVENKLPGANTFKDTAKILVGTRLSCAWGALGSAVGGFDAALSYAKSRKQFGKPLAGHQIIQQRLVKMLADVTAMQLYCLQMTRLAEQGRLGDTLAGLGKFHNTTRARAVLAEGTRPVGRQRNPARTPGDQTHGRPRGHPHVRGHRDHPGADRRARHHRHQRIRLTAATARDRNGLARTRDVPDTTCRTHCASGQARAESVIL